MFNLYLDLNVCGYSPTFPENRNTLLSSHARLIRSYLKKDIKAYGSFYETGWSNQEGNPSRFLYSYLMWGRQHMFKGTKILDP